MNNASEIKVGDVVEFDIGSPVLVMEIENNYNDSNRHEDSEYMRRSYGESLVFSCSYTETDLEMARRMGANTLYVRRALSPISGPRVVR